jgi:hypothetical protein
VVAAVGEETLCVQGRERRERSSHRLDQRFTGARFGFSQQPFDLGEGLLDGVEIRRVGRKVEELCSPTLDDLLNPAALVGGEVIHHYHLPRRERRRQDPLQVGLEDLPRRSALDRQAQGPRPSSVMLASSVRFLPQFLGALPKVRCSPLRDQAYSADSETLAPISSTNTSRLVSTSSATKTRQAALKNSSRSAAPSDLFFGSILDALASPSEAQHSHSLFPGIID